MKKYTEPIITLLLFDEEEVLTMSGRTKTYAANELNKVLMGDEVGMKGTTTVTLEDITITGE
ncbi:MAG: hypothetical protein Q4G33_12630 [bacterium]|nr:hypothetical protein [bacterium]